MREYVLKPDFLTNITHPSTILRAVSLCIYFVTYEAKLWRKKAMRSDDNVIDKWGADTLAVTSTKKKYMILRILLIFE